MAFGHLGRRNLKVKDDQWGFGSWDTLQMHTNVPNKHVKCESMCALSLQSFQLMYTNNPQFT